MERGNGEDSRQMFKLAARISMKFMAGVAVVLVVMMCARAAYNFGYSVFNEQPVSYGPGRNVTVRITRTMTVQDIAQMLEENGLIKNSTLFCIQNRISPYSGEMKEGRYTLNTSMKPREMMRILAGRGEEEETKEEAGSE